jgi:uncharacterized DUF497 family protein
MKDRRFLWDEKKNEWLQRERGFSFDDVVVAYEHDFIIDDIDHPTRKNQRILVVELDNFICAVPYVKDGEVYFLKTIYPSRDLRKIYRG